MGSDRARSASGGRDKAKKRDRSSSSGTPDWLRKRREKHSRGEGGRPPLDFGGGGKGGFGGGGKGDFGKGGKDGGSHRWNLSLSLSLSLYVYIYIYIERERDR